jgi:phosphatidylglycerophosphatase A
MVPAWIGVTCCGIGKIPYIPGTAGAVLTLGLWNLWKDFFSVFWWGVLLCFLLPLSWLAILRILRQTTEKDPPYIVIDEALGQLLALICAPQTGLSGFCCFLLFRLFDVWKIGPIRWIDLRSKQGGTSPKTAAACILGDDLLAGLCAGLLVRFFA